MCKTDAMRSWRLRGGGAVRVSYVNVQCKEHLEGQYCRGLVIMWCGIQVFVSLLLVLIVGIASAFPLPPDASSYRASASTSPRISCTTLDNGLACRKFQVPIVHRKATIPSLQVPLLDTSTWPSSLVEEDREIQRIMDVKIAKVQHSERVQHNERKPWSIPDVQVVLWFIILCCLTEGIVMGFRW